MNHIFKPVGVESIFPIVLRGFEKDQYERLANVDAKLKWVIQFLLRRKILPAAIHEGKSAERSTKFITLGSEIFGIFPWKHVAEEYSRGVIHAPPDSKELALAYGNRSAILHNAGLIKECVLDIERALKNPDKYPDKLKAKLYARKARCLYALNNDAFNSEVEEAVAESRKWLDKMDDGRSTRKILDSLVNRQSRKKFEETKSDNFFPPIAEANRKIVGASSAIEIKYTEKFGRHLVATRKIQAGETLFKQNAYASAILPEYRLKYCWHCSKRTYAGVPCHQCVSVIYCSESCRDTAWLESHDMECNIIASVIHDGTARFELMIVKLLAKAVKEAGSLEKLKETLDKIDEITDPVTKCHAGKLLDTKKYLSIYTTSSGSKFEIEVAVKCVFILFYLATIPKLCGGNICNLRDLLNNKLALYLGKLVIKHYVICESNCFDLCGYNEQNKTYRFGWTINPVMNLVNHDCDPTACAITTRGVGALIATQRHNKGDQIFISYAPSFWLRTLDDRRAWMDRFEFKCDCKACSKYWGPLTISTFPSYTLSITKRINDLFSEAWRNHEDSYMANHPVPKVVETISNLSKIMNAHQQVKPYPTQEMVKIKYTVMKLYSHGSNQLNRD